MIEYTILVNEDNPLPEVFEAEDIIDLYSIPNRSFFLPFWTHRDVLLNRIAAEAANRFFAAAEKEHIDNFLILSGLRSREEQTDLYKRIKNGIVAKPGCSEHETGLAIDVRGLISSMSKKQVDWLVANCTDYGFIQRYPETKMHITKIPYDRAHFRYVGVEAAREMRANNWTLEEYHANKNTGYKIDLGDMPADHYSPEFIFLSSFGHKMKGHWQHYPDINLEELKTINPETAGWIHIKGTPLNNPIVYGDQSHFYYITHNFSGEVSPHGQIFVGASDGEPLTGRNTVLIGHHMKDGSMFKTLCRLVENKLDINKYPTAELLYGNKRYKVSWFSGFFFNEKETEPTRVSFENDEDFKAWLNAILSRSRIQTNIIPSANDHILTCTTCVFIHDRIDNTGLYGLLQEI